MYLPFMEELDRLFEGTAEICAVSHLGHHESTRHLVTIQEQIDHLYDFFSKYMLADEREIIVISHSFGSYLMANVLPRLPEHQLELIDSHVCLFPFFKFDPENPSAAHVRRVSRWYNWMGCICASLGAVLSVPRLKAFMNWAEGRKIEDACATECVRLFRPYNARQYFGLANEYLSSAGSQFDWTLLDPMPVRRTALLRCSGDRWFTDKIHDEMVNVRGIRFSDVVVTDSAFHGFVMCNEAAKTVAKYVYDITRKTLKNVS